MNITLSIDEKLVKKVERIAVERRTSLAGLVREYLEKLANESTTAGRRRRELKALERTFRDFHFRMGKRAWTRKSLYKPS
jgi:Family of unknown function (DUF6364)